MWRLIAVILIVTACARASMPPGGPVDTTAPQVVRIVPDSGSTRITPPSVIFRFDEVVSERPVGTATTLSDLFLISPRDGAPSVDWSREEITVKPRKGWRKNIPYTITLLPGLADLRGNVRNTATRVFFSTGDSIPETRLTGRVFNWPASVVARNAFVEALLRPDSINFVTVADTAGAFVFERLPAGTYTIRAFLDDDRDRGLDPLELWDTLTVALRGTRDSLSAELLTFMHDTSGPGIEDIRMLDSMRLQIDFDKPVDVDQRILPAMFTLISTKDSAAVAIQRVSAPPADSAARNITILPKRKPIPQRSVVLFLASPIQPGTQYTLAVADLRGLLGSARTSSRTFTVPKRSATISPPAASE